MTLNEMLLHEQDCMMTNQATGLTKHNPSKYTSLLLLSWLQSLPDQTVPPLLGILSEMEVWATQLSVHVLVKV